MADHNPEEVVPQAEGDDSEEGKGYQRPKPKPLTEILNTDKEDESLRKYKESLGLTTANAGDLEVCEYIICSFCIKHNMFWLVINNYGGEMIC